MTEAGFIMERAAKRQNGAGMKKKLIMLLCCLCIVGVSQQVYAQENTELPSLVIEESGSGETVGEQYNSVLQIVVSFTDEEGNVIPIQGGSGFLIGDDETQLQYMITTNRVAVVSDKVKENLRKSYKLEKAEDIKEELKIVINKDVTIAASVVTASEEMDFAILQLSQPLHDRQVLLLNDKGAEEYAGQPALVLGYPGAVKTGQEMTYYTGVDLQKTEGFLETEEIINGQKYIRHHIFPNYGNLGGPILDENGNIAALNQSRNDGKSFYALEVTEIMHVMDSLGIPYKTVSQVEAEQAAALAAIVHKEKLDSVIVRAEKLDLSDYKKKSTEGFEECLKEAKEVQKNENATQTEVDEAAAKMQETMNALVPKMPLKTVLTIIAGCCIFAVVVFLVIMKVTSKARKERREKKQAEFKVTEPAPVFKQSAPVPETSYRDLVLAGNGQVENRNIWNVQDENEYEQTTVLSESADESPTSVLMQQSATLIRSRDNENILIHKFPFVLGKDMDKTDYCVRNNPAVSRIHATMLYENHSYFIQDNQATNGTFVNGKRLAAGSKMGLKNNDKVSLGNEEFEFKI